MSKYIHFRHSSGVRWTVCSACSPQGCDDTCSHQIVGHVTPSVESCCSILQHVVASIIIIYRSASHILVAHLVNCNSIQFFHCQCCKRISAVEGAISGCTRAASTPNFCSRALAQYRLVRRQNNICNHLLYLLPFEPLPSFSGYIQHLITLKR